MGWGVGYDEQWDRYIGYGVPAECDQPGCESRIDRGLSYVCGSDPYGGEHGCGLYFCNYHLYAEFGPHNYWLCEQCINHEAPFEPKPDVKEWVMHQMTHPSWAVWREGRA